MGASLSNNQSQKLNQSVHGSLDIGVCGYDLKNGQMKPAKCSNNMSSNDSNHMTSLISDLNMPNLPVNACIPIGPNIGVKLKKDLNSKPNDIVSNFKLSTCSHGYYDINNIHIPPEYLRIDDIGKTFYDMNIHKLEKLNVAMLNKSQSDIVHTQPFPNSNKSDMVYTQPNPNKSDMVYTLPFPNSNKLPPETFRKLPQLRSNLNKPRPPDKVQIEQYANKSDMVYKQPRPIFNKKDGFCVKK